MYQSELVLSFFLFSSISNPVKKVQIQKLDLIEKLYSLSLVQRNPLRKHIITNKKIS